MKACFYAIEKLIMSIKFFWRFPKVWRYNAHPKFLQYQEYVYNIPSKDYPHSTFFWTGKTSKKLPLIHYLGEFIRRIRKLRK